VSILLVLLVVLLSLHRWLMEPLLAAAEAVLELGALPWFAVIGVAWLLAGPTEERR
jgi:hypothetical protein